MVPAPGHTRTGAPTSRNLVTQRTISTEQAIEMSFDAPVDWWPVPPWRGPEDGAVLVEIPAEAELDSRW